MNQISFPHARLQKTYICQGEFAILKQSDSCISTLLGSCVSACIWDPQEMVGGMNHVLFVGGYSDAEEHFGYGVNGMELLINGLLKAGARRQNMRAKVFGGAQMFDGLSDAGSRNGEFVLDFLSRESIAYVGGDIGGVKARQVEFHPATGRARQKLINDRVCAAPVLQDTGTGIELF
ncbi:chemotaxis protein CheD [uncultured Aliiroseovarius sp.]|uniref:chemotaxis protein CheD n=1 Tax=uncultured Aliiroseovarius sp. TaxID=1658783 RepID=UPI002624CFA2|nr:chemotaxis protein CheD [uncultured Aliiroseovarius sp.]